MIPNMWYAVADSDEIKPGKPYGLRRMGDDLVFWRDQQGKIVVMLDRCPHRSAKLSPGKIVDGNIQCGFHGFQYNAEGDVQLIPANGRSGPKPKAFKCRKLEAREAHGFIWLWNGEDRDEYPPIPWFDNLDGFSYHNSTSQTHWEVDYTRAVEAQLDVSHLPFVHENTIGRGNQTLVNGPYTTLEDNVIRVWLSNQPDEGLPALKPSQLPPPEVPQSIYFIFPNVWQLRLTDKMCIVSINAPIDDENVITYSRTYQNILRVPGLSRLFVSASNRFNQYALSEDYRVTKTQLPKKADLDIGERFIPGDRPIALYLQHRRKLILEGQGNGLPEHNRESV
jgi:phenylpropionate dioxygenase-like ring-hydroxylating dioxygenase large terminal subunit